MARNNEGIPINDGRGVHGPVNLVTAATPDLAEGETYVFQRNLPQRSEQVVWIGQFDRLPNPRTDKRHCFALDRENPTISFDVISGYGIYAFTNQPGERANIAVQEAL